MPQRGSASVGLSLPFVIGVLADLCGSNGSAQPPIEQRKMLEWDIDNFDRRMTALQPRATFLVPNALLGTGSFEVSLTFRCMDDFSPGAVARNVPALAALLEARRQTATTNHHTTVSHDRAADTERALEAQLNLILHHPAFRRLEAAWRGLYHLVSNVETDTTLLIRVMHVTKAELGERFRRHPDDANPLRKKLHDDEFHMLGGQPYGCVIGDYEFANTAEDLGILAGMARIGTICQAPFIAAAAPKLLGLDRWQQFAPSSDLRRLLREPSYDTWRALRASDEGKYVVLTLPRFLARLPYGRDTHPVEDLTFEEIVHSPTGADELLWANAAYLLGVNLARAYKNHGWCAAISGLEGGGGVDGLPAYPLSADSSEPYSAEIAIDDRSIVGFAEEGFSALIQSKSVGAAFFLSLPTLHRPHQYSEAEATVTAKLAARLPYVLVLSRIAHLLRVLNRWFGDSIEIGEREQRLNAWLTSYVLIDPELHGEQTRCQKPLSEARISLSEVAGDPGKVTGRLELNAHYQIYQTPRPLVMRILF